MNEADAIRELPRTYHRIMMELDAARRDRTEAIKLVAECAALDFRPIVVCGDHLEYTRDFNIPENIKQFARDAAEAVAKLELELYEAMRNRPYGSTF